ncbi:MAG: methyltransferase domain-containing protein [Deltaproteobacteria bacterium]|nr:methyltransferase domain-containing protein [Deltaproteobacteria bacterium]
MTAAKRTHKHEKLARIYDDEILPIWSHRFGRLLLRDIDVPPRAMVLDVACGTGYPALEMLRRLDDQSRLIAIDASSAMLDMARRKAGDLSGKRVFFRTETIETRLSFTDDVYDLVVCNLGLSELPQPARAFREFVRVAKPGGKVACTLPLAGTWGEFYDIYREVLVKHDKVAMLERLDAHLKLFPEPEELERWSEDAGLVDARVELDEFALLFRSSREFFFAPVVEYGPLSSWKEIAGSKGQELQDVFWAIKQAIDAYFGERAFQITVKVGCVRGTKPLTPPEPKPREDGQGTGSRAGPADEDLISVNTGEVEVLEVRPAWPESSETSASSDSPEIDEESKPEPCDEPEEELEAFKEGAPPRSEEGSEGGKPGV